MVGAARVQVTEYDLYDLKLTQEEDGAVETLDPQFCMGFELLEILEPTFLDLLLGPTFVMSLSFPDLLLLGCAYLTTVVDMEWVPTGKLLNSCTGKVNSEPTHGSIVDIPHIQACKQTLGLSAETSARMVSQKMSYIKWCLLKITLQAPFLNVQKTFEHSSSSLGRQCQMPSAENNTSSPVPQCSKRRLIVTDQASVFMAMTSVHISSGLVLHQMTSGHNRSEIGIHDHSNEPSSSKLVPKVIPLAVVRLGINPMIQPEPEDLPKDNPKLEIAVLSDVIFEILQSRTPMITEPSGTVESPSMDTELAAADSETESDEMKARLDLNPGIQDEGQAGSNPGNATEFQPQPSHVVYVGPNLEPIDLAVSDASTQQNPKQMDEEFTTTAYPNFFVEKPQEEEPEKTNAEYEVQSMVTVPIHQDTSSVPPMTTPVIDLTTSQSDSSLPTSTATTTTITTTTTLPPPPPQPQQSTTDPIIVQRIENLNIPQKVSKAIDEIVTDAVDWAMQAPLRARFSDLPVVDMKEILQQRMFEDNSYKAHEVHQNLFEALQKSLERDYSNQLLADLNEARRKKRGKRNSPRTPRGSEAPSLSKTAASTPPSMAWTTSDPRYVSTSFIVAQETSPIDYMMHDDSIPDEQVHVSDDENTGNDHLPKAGMRKDWWKPLPREERPATPEPDWTIPSTNVSDVENNWAFALGSTYEPPAENSLLAKTRDMTTFINWYRQKFQMEECHKMFTDQINWANPEGDQVQIVVSRHSSRELPATTPPVNFQMKAARYPEFGLELLVSEQMWIDEVCTYDKSTAYGISHWWFNRQKFYIDRHDSPSHRREVRKHMRILSVVRIQAHSRYGWTLKILNLLLHGHLNHLPSLDKRMLSTTVNPWTRNLVIRQRVEDLQLGIESYQKQLNLTKPRWDAKGFEYKHDYTIIESPRAVAFPVRNNERMRFNEIHKFSDGTLTTILEAPDYKVNEYKVNRLNPVDIEKVAVRSSLRSLKSKRTIESRAKRSLINLIRTLFHITCSSHNVKTRVIIRVLRIILVVLPEHPSDTYVFTMKMEILLEPTSNKLMVGKLGDSDVHTLEDPTLILEILSRRFFLRLNLPDHRSVLTGSGGSSKDGDGDTFIKVKGTSRTTNNQAFTIKKGMSMPVQMSPAQDGERQKVDDQRLDLADDLKEAQDHISSTITSHKTKITTSMYKISHEESKTTS
ncbi:hypothetical protein Tco_1045235 [Tanacetum coccineum]|uniref:Reverse transcriptase domain-containing protein n=1 Tax=Tanacetum coccineum TaxID=301880 RepID=A0ABQ5GT99_9ASTR